MRTKKILFLMGSIISGFAILIVFLSVVLYFVLLLPPVQQYILIVAKPFYKNIFNGKTSIGAIKSNLISYVLIENVEIRDSIHHENAILIDHVEIAFWAPALLFNKLVINSISANKVSVSISVPRDHKFSFPAIPRTNVAVENGTKKTWKVEMGAVRIKKINIEYKDSSNGVFASVKDAAVGADFYRLDSLKLRINGYKNSVRTPWWSSKIDSLLVASVITSKGIDIKSLTLKGPMLLLQADGSLPFDKTDRCDLNGLIHTDLKSFPIAKTSSQWKNHGVVTIKAHWGGSFLKPILHVYADGYKIKFEKILVNSLNMECEYKNDLLSMVARVRSGDLKAMLTGESEISGLFSNPQFGKYTVKIALEGQTVSALKIIIPYFANVNTGKVSVNANASGYGLVIPDKTSANVIVENSDNNNLIANLKLNKHLWKLDGAWAENKISGQGTLSEKLLLTGKLKLNFPEVKPVALTLLDQKISGEFKSDLTFSGVLPLLDIKAELHCKNINWNKLTLSTLSGKVHYKEKILNIESMDASISGESDSILRMLNIDSCGGTVHLDVKASGTLVDLNADVIFQGTGMYYKRIVAHSVFADLNINTADSMNLRKIVIENDKSRIIASGLVVLKPEMEINLNAGTEIKAGSSNWNSSGGVRINAKMTNKKNIESTLSTSELNVGIVNQWYPLPYNISGSLTSNVEINGSPLNPLLNAQIELNQAAFNNVKIRNVRGSVSLIDSVVNSKFLISISDTLSHVHVDATIPVRPKRNWNIDLSGNRERMVVITSDTLNIADIISSKNSYFSMDGLVFGQLMIKGDGPIWRLDGNAKLLGNEFYYAPYNVNGKNIVADLRIQGSSDNPDISFNYSSGEIKVSSQIITQTRLNGRIKEKTVLIDSASVGVDNRDVLTISGQIPLTTMDSLLSKSESVIRYKMVALPLKLLEIIAPNIYVTAGVFNGNGTISILNGKLRSDGLLSLTNGTVETEIIDQKIGPFNGTLVFKGDTIVLENWTGVIDKGSFNLGGKGTLLSDGTLGLLLTLIGKNLNLDAHDIIKLQMQTVEMQLRNGRQKKHYILDGKINFGPTRFIRDVQISDIVALSKPKDEVIATKSIFDSIDLRLELQFQDNLYVDMNLGNMQLAGDVVVTGIVSKPAFAGEINVVQGDIFYLDRKFEINKGNINFVSPTELNPSIYVDAKTEVNTFAQGTTQNITYYITLIVSGTLEHPVVSLTSDPQLDEPNIVSVLTLGTTMGSVGSDIASRIGSMVGNKFLGFGTRSLERLLGLESISVSGNIFDAKDTLNGPQLSVTKRLSDRLILSYESTFGTSNRQKISILYRLFPFLFLTGQTETSGDSKIILKFRINR